MSSFVSWPFPFARVLLCAYCKLLLWPRLGFPTSSIPWIPHGAEDTRPGTGRGHGQPTSRRLIAVPARPSPACRPECPCCHKCSSCCHKSGGSMRVEAACGPCRHGGCPGRCSVRVFSRSKKSAPQSVLRDAAFQQRSQHCMATYTSGSI